MIFSQILERITTPDLISAALAGDPTRHARSSSNVYETSPSDVHDVPIIATCRCVILIPHLALALTAPLNNVGVLALSVPEGDDSDDNKTKADNPDGGEGDGGAPPGAGNADGSPGAGGGGGGGADGGCWC